MKSTKALTRGIAPVVLTLLLFMASEEASAQFRLHCDGFSAVGGRSASASSNLLAAGGLPYPIGTSSSSAHILNPGFIPCIGRSPGSTIVVSSPAAGVTWTAGTNQTVAWSSSGVTGNVNIRLSTNGGTTFPLALASNTANDGTESITVPNNPSTTCRVRVESVSNSSVFGDNPGPFTIQTDGEECNPSDCAGPAVFPTREGGALGEIISGSDGTSLVIDIRLKQNPSVIGAFGVDVKVNPAHLQFVSGEKGDLTTGFIVVNAGENPAGSGMIICGGFGTTPIPANSNGVLVRLRFNVTCSGSDRSEVSLANLRDGLTGLSACCNIFACAACVSNGDVNNDGSLTPGDALCAFEIFLNGGTAPASCDVADFDCEATAADVNCDGSVTPGDALAIFERFLIGQPPAECFGLSSLDKSNSQNEGRELTLQPRFVIQAAEPQEILKLTLKVSQPSGISAFGLMLAYPADQLELVGIERSVLTKDWLQLDGRLQEPGVMTIGGYDDKPLAASSPDALFHLIFAAKGQLASAADFKITQLVDGLSTAMLKTDASSSSELSGVPGTFKLYQSYPNPFSTRDRSSTTAIRFDLPGTQGAKVELAIYNLAGQLVRKLVTGEKTPGAYEVAWNAHDDNGQEVPSGVYLYRLSAGQWMETKRLVVVK